MIFLYISLFLSSSFESFPSELSESDASVSRSSSTFVTSPYTFLVHLTSLDRLTLLVERLYILDVSPLYCLVYPTLAAPSPSQKRRKQRFTFTVGLHENDVWSGGYFTKKMKELAIQCEFKNPTRFMGQGKRAEGISRMVNSGEDIPLRESMRVARHGSTEAHLGYAKPDEGAHSKRYRAMASKTVRVMKGEVGDDNVKGE